MAQKLTRVNIEKKLGRKRNPVQSATRLAEEFGRDTIYRRSNGSYGQRPPQSFVREVKSVVGEKFYNERIRDSHSVNLAYR